MEKRRGLTPGTKVSAASVVTRECEEVTRLLRVSSQLVLKTAEQARIEKHLIACELCRLWWVRMSGYYRRTARAA